MNGYRYSSFIIRTLLAVCICATPVDAGPFQHCRTTCAPVRVCQTVYRAGEQDGQLQVHISGTTFNTVETYLFDNYYVDAISGEMNLHCCSQILLAPPSDYGTFAIRYGRSHDQFVAYGVFKKGKQIKITNDSRQLTAGNVGLVVGVDTGFPISLGWVSTRLLKIKHGPQGSKSLVLKFFGAEGEGYWSVLDGDGTATQVVPPSP
jgi:hypothetical protein